MPTINFNVPNDLYIGGDLYIQGTLVNPNGGGGGGGGVGSGIPTLNGLSGVLNVVGTGGLSVSTGVGRIIISGDQSISGFVLGASGALQALIAGGGTQVRVSGSSTISIADFTGIGGAVVLFSGGKVFISGGAGGGGSVGGGGSGVTGINGLSGAAVRVIGTGGLTVFTGAPQTLIISGDSSKISGPASSTDNYVALWDGTSGRALKNSTAVAIDGVTTSAGAADAGKVPLLDSNGLLDSSFIPGGGGGGANSGIPSLNALSGLPITIAGTGGLTVMTGIGLPQRILVSGDQSISGALTQSGVQAINYARGIGTIISGNLTSTGIQLGAKIDSLSGFTLGASGALQTLIAGGGSQVRISGSSTISIADFTGIAGVSVVYSGGKVFVSGTAAGAAGVSSLNGLAGSINVIGSGGLAALTIGQNIIISGDQSISGALTQTGVQALLYARGIGTIISGNLTSTGVQLKTNIDVLSGYIEQRFVHRTGDEFITGAKSFQSELRVNSSLRVAGSYFGATNYTFGTGDYIIIATGAVANVTGIFPDIRVYSGNVFTVINSRTIALPLSGIIGFDRNPILNPYDSVSVYGGSGLYHYIRQTGINPEPKLIQFAISDQTTALTAGVNKFTFRNVLPFTLTGVRASVFGASAGSTIIFDINKNGTTVLSTKLSIDAGEKTSTTAASAAVISVRDFADDDEVGIDIDQVGSTNAGTGAMIAMMGI